MGSHYLGRLAHLWGPFRLGRAIWASLLKSIWSHWGVLRIQQNNNKRERERDVTWREREAVAVTHEAVSREKVNAQVLSLRFAAQPQSLSGCATDNDSFIEKSMDSFWTFKPWKGIWHVERNCFAPSLTFCFAVAPGLLFPKFEVLIAIRQFWWKV